MKRDPELFAHRGEPGFSVKPSERKTKMKHLNGKTRTITAMAAIAISTGFAADARTRPPRYKYVQLNVPGSRPHTTVPTGINNNNVVVGYYAAVIGCCYLTNGFS